MKNKVLIIGLGQIGFEYDSNNSDEGIVLSHARAFSSHPYFELVGGVDNSPEQCSRFIKQYGCMAGSDLISILEKTIPDVVVVATSTVHHGSVLRTVLENSNPRVILCEKPLSFDLEEARGMLRQSHEKNCLLFVNYLRRAEPGVREVKLRFQNGQIANPVKGVTWYTKGLLHNGSHFVNLLEYWLGKATSFKVISTKGPHDTQDCEPDVQITFPYGKVTFLAAQKENYSFHEVDLICPNGRLRYLHGGSKIIWQKTEQDPQFANYTVLSSIEDEIPSFSQKAQWHVADQLAVHLNSGVSSLCNGEDALQTIEFLMNIRAAL